MHEKLVEIVRLTEDSSYSHAARMIKIRDLAREILKALAEPSGAQGGAKAGIAVPKQGSVVSPAAPR